MKFNKINRILNVIRSCKTQAQLDSCKTWVRSIKYIKESNTEFIDSSNYIAKMQLETAIIQIQTQMIKDKGTILC